MARVLIVEDMALLALSLRDMVEELGHEVVGMAGAVDEALQKVESSRPDVVMLDADLRGHSSAPVAQKLRANQIPFVIASGFTGAQLDEIGTEEPRLAKPVGRRQLGEVLKRLTAGLPD